jgi:hypothetical protein
MNYVIIVVHKMDVYTLMGGNRGQDAICHIGVPEKPSLISDELYKFSAKEISGYSPIAFARNEHDAKSIAKEYAKANPGANVSWGLLVGQFETVPSEPIEKTISEKGVLPV